MGLFICSGPSVLDSEEQKPPSPSTRRVGSGALFPAVLATLRLVLVLPSMAGLSASLPVSSRAGAHCVTPSIVTWLFPPVAVVLRTFLLPDDNVQHLQNNADNSGL